jgi:ABC-type glycerol-3-phosphate transport system substrate-binding protein
MQRRRAAVLALAAVLTATACDGDTHKSGELAGQTVEVAATWSGAEQQTFQAVLDAFTRKTGATVRYTSGGNDLAVLLNTRIAGGAPPDVALVPQPGVVAQLVARGAVKELTGAAAQAVAANYSPAWRELGSIDGKLYGVWFKVANKSVIWYSVEAFDTAGAGTPGTWEEFKATSKVIADSGTTPMVVPGADGWPLTDWFENVYLRIAGAELYDRLARHDLPWTHPTVVEALRMIGEYWATPKTVQAGAVQTTFTQSIADVFGGKPRAAMLFEGDFVYGEINRLGRVKVGPGARFFTWPSINGSLPAVVTAGDQAVALKNTKGAMRLMEFLASPEAAAVWAGKGGYLSANRNLPPTAYPDATMRRLGEALVKAEVLRFDLSDLAPQAFGGQTGADMWRVLQEFLANPAADPAGIARRLEEAARKDYRSP